MDYNLFKEELLLAIQDLADPEQSVSLHCIDKNNGSCADAVIIMKKGDQIAPTFYLDDFYPWFCQGISIERIARRILELNQQHQPEASFALTDEVHDYQKMRTHVCYKLINYEMNRSLLNKIPHIPYLDLAIVFYCKVTAPNLQNGSFLIHNSNLTAWNVSTDDLIRDARLNTCRKLPFCFKEMDALIRELSNDESLLPSEFSPNSMYILTNQETYFGAAALLYPHVLSHISALLGCNFFVLPSSVHECILVPDFGVYSKPELEEMVVEVNSTQVAKEEVLSNHVYYYDLKKQELSL